MMNEAPAKAPNTVDKKTLDFEPGFSPILKAISIKSV